MVYKDTQRRVLKNDAVPTKNLIHVEAINQSNIASTSKNNDFTSCENVNSELTYEENVQCNPNFTPVFQSAHKKEATITYRRKLRQLKKLLWKKNKIIRKQKQEKKIPI